MMREAKIAPGANGQKSSDQTVDNFAASTTVQGTADGAVTAASKCSEAVASSKPPRNPASVPFAPSLEKQSQPQPVAGGNNVDRPATNGVAITPTKALTSGSNSLGREQSKRAVANGWHNRSNSVGNASDIFLQQVTADFANTSPVKPNGEVQQLQRTESVGAANGTAPSSVPSQPGAQGVQKMPCVSNFDPLHQNPLVPSIAGDTVPVMMPTQVSLVDAPSPVFQQNPNDPAAYQSRTNGFPSQYEQNEFVAENNIVVPVTLDMARAIDQANMENRMQHQGINRDRNLQSSFMVFPQQQPIMVQNVAGGVQQVPNVIAGQLRQAFPSNGNTLPSYVPQLTQQPPSQIFYSTDSFDPLK